MTTTPSLPQAVLTERDIVRCLVESGCIGTVKMSYDSGPYEITRTSINADRFARAIESAILSRMGGEAVPAWQPIETAPKSTADGDHVSGIYLLGFCPDPDSCNLESQICIIWWEPLMNKGAGLWYGEGGYEVHPTHWQPLPAAPTAPAQQAAPYAYVSWDHELGAFSTTELSKRNPHARQRPVYLGEVLPSSYDIRQAAPLPFNPALIGHEGGHYERPGQRAAPCIACGQQEGHADSCARQRWGIGQQAADVQGEPRLPDGWVPLRIAYAPDEDPEDVAFGPQRMMDRLKKWLDSHFANLAAAQSVPKVGAQEVVPAEVARNAVGYVGAANYQERQEQAESWIEDAAFMIPAASAPTVGGDVLFECGKAAGRQEVLDEQTGPDFWGWVRRAYRNPEATSFTVHNMAVAYRAGRDSAAQEPSAAAEPVAGEGWKTSYSVRVGRDNADCIDLVFTTVGQREFQLYPNEAAHLRDLLNAATIPGYPPTPPSAPAGAGEGERAELIQKARGILHRLCDKGLLSMSIPVRHDRDEDLILSAVIDLAEAAATPSHEGPDADLAKTIACFDEGVDTEASYEQLMRWANAGFLHCERFTATAAGRAARAGGSQ